MRRYFISGGTGFIGREIVRQLLLSEDTAEIMLLTRHPKQRYEMLKWDSRITLYDGEITETLFPRNNFTDLIHGANEVNDTLQPDQHHYYYTIVEGTKRILQWAKLRCIPRRIILSSGAANRDTIYGRAKRVAEHLAHYYGGATKIARIYSVLGSEMPMAWNGQYAAGRFVWQAMNDGKVSFYGGGSERTYLDVSECAQWLLTILDRATPLVPVDVAGSERISIFSLAHLVALVFGVPVEHIDGPNRVDTYLPDLSAAHEFGLKQTITIRKSLEAIREAMLRHTDLEAAR